MSVWLAILASGALTYLTRALPLALRVRLPERGAGRTYLDALPTSIIAALAGAAVLAPDDRLTRGAEPLGAAVAVLIAAWRRQVLFAMLGGVAAVAVARALGH